MHDPIRTVIISCVAFFLLTFGILTYHYIYPKKKINLFVLLILLSLLPLISLVRPGDYESGDFNIHLYRTIEFYRSLSEGHILPSWAGNLNATYGLPLFIFNYTLPYYIICFFHFIGFSFITSMKLFLASNFIFSGIFMYMASKKLFRDDLAAFMSTIFYQFAPYHLEDIHFKIVIGEIMIFTLIPLLFYCLLNLWEKKNSLWISLTSLAIVLLVTSHVTIALFIMVLFFCYAIFAAVHLKKKSILITTTVSFILGCTGTLFVLLTPLFLTQYTIVPKIKFIPSFPNFFDLFYSPWRFGFLFQGHKGEISPLIGYSHIISVITVTILWLRKKIVPKHLQPIIFWLVSLICLIFLISSLSAFIWSTVPFLKSTGGSHRLLINVAFISAIVAGYLSFYIHNKILLWLFIGFTIFSTILNWGHRNILPGIDDQYLMKNLWKSTYLADGHYFANSKWRNVDDQWFSELPKAHLISTEKPVNIVELQRLSTVHTYILSTSSDLTLNESTLYFPGWQVFDNNKPIQINPNLQGVISFKLSKGLHYIVIKYEDLLVYKLLKLLSVTMILCMLLIVLVLTSKRVLKR
jgi:uncharacterized membrane protein